MLRRICLTLLTGLGLLGCTAPGGDTPDGAADLAAADLGGADGRAPGGPDLSGGSGPNFDRAAGTIEALEVSSPQGFNGARVEARFLPAPEEVFQQEVARVGACRLLLFKPALCEAPCIGVCVDTNVCRPFQARISAGTVTLRGLKVPVVMKPQAQNYYYADPAPPADLFDAGAAVTAEVTGGAFAGFSVASAGVAPIAARSPVNDQIDLADGADYLFRWTPAGPAGARVRLTLNANNRGHGAPYAGILECDTEDTGEVTIARQLIAAFPATSRWEICAGSDCPLSWIMRYRRGATTAGGRSAALVVGSRREFFVVHPPK